MDLKHAFSHTFARLALVGAFLLAALTGFSGQVLAARDAGGAVYTITNSPSGNQVLEYTRSANGSLAFHAAYAAGGLGSGASLGSQGALVLTQDNRWLVAVDAGSNQVSVFAVRANGLALTDVVDSGGTMPVSVTAHDNLVYVLNEGGSGNISGFRMNSHGMLTPAAGSTQMLSNAGVGSAPGGAEIGFTPDGSSLVVTEKGTNLVDTFAVEDGVAGAAMTHASSGPTPYGFAFNKRGTLVVSEAFGGAPNASALSSYTLDGGFSLVSGSIATTQTAACWVAISKNGKFAYTTNAGSASISSYAIQPNGAISLINPTAGLTGAGAVDMAFSSNGAFLYNMNSGAHSIGGFRMQSDGSLVALGTVSLPAGTVGLAAR